MPTYIYTLYTIQAWIPTEDIAKEWLAFSEPDKDHMHGEAVNMNKHSQLIHGTTSTFSPVLLFIIPFIFHVYMYLQLYMWAPA